MYNKWLCFVITFAIAVAAWFTLCVCKQWSTNKSDRAKNIVASVMILIFAIIALIETSDRLQIYELSHYEKLFSAQRVECNDCDVTDLIRSYENECWNFKKMEECSLEEPYGEIIGVICFYDEKEKLFQEINIIQLNESSDNQRILHAKDRYYAFVSGDWKNVGYVYGFPKELAEQLLFLC